MNKPTFGTYRGWNGYHRGWIYGALINRDNECFIISNEFNPYDMLIEKSFYEHIDLVPTKSIGMCTGESDSKDTAIYVGDIIQKEDLSVWVLACNIMHGFRVYEILPSSWGDNVPFTNITRSRSGYCVIGNAWQNPELLYGNMFDSFKLQMWAMEL